MSKTGSKEVGSIFTDEDDAKDFLTYLQEANNTDLTDIEHSGCVSEGRDLREIPLIVMIPSLGLNKIDKPEVLFRKMLLLFIKKANEIVGKEYSVVYAHTNLDIINQYPLIYKFYSVLPRSFKKNLQKMYIIHPNVGIRMFFEFARVFLSQKFYQKLCLVESVLDFQRIVPPTQLALPLKFLYKEDEEHGLKYCGTLASLSVSFDPALGTTKIIDVCTHFLLENHFHQQQGIFRIPGDEGELNLARVRLQYANIDGFISSGRIEISANRRSIIIGDLDALYKKKHSHPSSGGSGHHHTNSGDIGENSGFKKLSKQEMEMEEIPAEVPMSVVVITNPNTVAQILKMAIRDLPEPLIPDDVYRDLIHITRTHDMNNLSNEWNITVAKRLSLLPIENFSTFAHIVSFLRDVAKESKTNNMDATNLATVFGPTIFRSSMDDPIKAVMELKVSHTILYNVIIRDTILQRATRLLKEQYRLKHGEGSSLDRMILDNPVLASQKFEMSIDLGELESLDAHQKSEIVDITSSISPAMINRMTRGGGGRDSASNLHNHNNSSSQYSHRNLPGKPYVPRGLELADSEEDEEDSNSQKKREESIEELGSNREPPLLAPPTDNDMIDIGVEIVDDDALLKSDSQERYKVNNHSSRKDRNIYEEDNDF